MQPISWGGNVPYLESGSTPYGQIESSSTSIRTLRRSLLRKGGWSMSGSPPSDSGFVLVGNSREEVNRSEGQGTSSDSILAVLSSSTIGQCAPGLKGFYSTS